MAQTLSLTEAGYSATRTSSEAAAVGYTAAGTAGGSVGWAVRRSENPVAEALARDNRCIEVEDPEKAAAVAAAAYPGHSGTPYTAGSMAPGHIPSVEERRRRAAVPAVAEVAGRKGRHTDAGNRGAERCCCRPLDRNWNWNTWYQGLIIESKYATWLAHELRIESESVERPARPPDRW